VASSSYNYYVLIVVDATFMSGDKAKEIRRWLGHSAVRRG